MLRMAIDATAANGIALSFLRRLKAVSDCLSAPNGDDLLAKCYLVTGVTCGNTLKNELPTYLLLLFEIDWPSRLEFTFFS